MNGQGCLLVELVLGLADILADSSPQLHFFIVAETIVARPRAISRHAGLIEQLQRDAELQQLGGLIGAIPDKQRRSG